ncbi:MAG: bifunctional hydroxymethylpyrimidine kinase/phosphomethylpyrimidine kinase [Desulfobacteraceae bacterium]|nr:MAG: bifunctional hydroxymethylpyrimidine kinase/phosphomethylpyrimidine kinase [Desulfobacteraceae bacterium]
MKRVLTVAGSDSGGGAGIQADLKAITVLGGYAMSAVTAVTAQNTIGVQGVHPLPVEFIRLQMESVISDIGVDAVKTGMLGAPQVVEAVADVFRSYLVEIVVVDPVMVTKSGDTLLSDDARDAMKKLLLPIARVVTPNLPEASVLSGIQVKGINAMREAARKIHELGPRFVLVKGGHLRGRAVDILFDGENFQEYESPRLDGRNTHGTGCTFSAAIATLLAQGRSVPDAVGEAKHFISRAIAMGIPLGRGHGPTNPYAQVLLYKDRENVLNEMEKALGLLLEARLARLIPEVRSNLCYALPGALSYMDVAGVPGRISTVGDRLLICRSPAFGASRHIARVVLAAMRKDPQMRAAMNIKYSKDILMQCRKAGLTTASFDRRNEPRSIREREGSTLDWGTDMALESFQGFPDLIFDEGDVGKEPMIRVLGKNPSEVAGKVIRIGMTGI